MAWVVRKCSKVKERDRGEHWIQLSSCLMCALEKKVGMVSGHSQRDWKRESICYRVVTALPVETATPEVSQARKKYSTVSAPTGTTRGKTKARPKSSLGRQASRRIPSEPERLRQVAVRSDETRTSNSTTAITNSMLQKMRDGLVEGMWAMGADSDPRGRAAPTAKPRRHAVDTSITSPGDRCMVLAEGPSLEEIYPIWVYVIYHFSVHTSPRRVKIIGLELMNSFRKLAMAQTCTQKAAHQSNAIVVTVEEQGFQDGEGLLGSWPCLQSRGLKRTLSYSGGDVRDGGEDATEKSRTYSNAVSSEDVLAVADARLLRASDSRVLNGSLRLETHFFTLWVVETFSASELTCYESRSEKYGINAFKIHVQRLKELHGDQSHVQHSLYRIPVVSILALCCKPCPCSRVCGNDILTILTSDDKYQVVVAETAETSNQGKSIFYLMDQVWRWVLSLTVQKSAQTNAARYEKVSRTPMTPTRHSFIHSPLVVPEMDFRSASPAFLTGLPPPPADSSPQLYSPLFDIPMDLAEVVIETKCICWLDLLFVSGYLRASRDLITFQSERDVNDTMCCHEFQAIRPFEGKPRVSFTIKLDGVERVSKWKDIVNFSEFSNPSVVDIVSSMGRRAIFSVPPERTDVFPLLMQLWAVAVRPPHSAKLRNRVKSTLSPLQSDWAAGAESETLAASMDWFVKKVEGECAEGSQPTHSDLWERYGGNRESFDPDLLRDHTLQKAIRQGVPFHLRASVWQISSCSIYSLHNSVTGSQRIKLLQNKPACLYRGDSARPRQSKLTYKDYLRRARADGGSYSMVEIERDLHRSFPSHPYFQTAEGKNSLRRVLVAYSTRNEDVGYCQSMNIVAALLLCWMPEVNAFWLLCHIVENILPNYYNPNLIGVVLDQKVLAHLVEENMPRLYSHLLEIGVALPAITMPWFMCVFILCLPWNTTLRFLDIFFCDGAITLFITSMAILKHNEERICAEEDPVEILKLLRNCGERFEVLWVLARQLSATVTEERIFELRNLYRPDIVKHAESRDTTQTDRRRSSDDFGQTEELLNLLRLEKASGSGSGDESSSSASSSEDEGDDRAGLGVVVPKLEDTMTSSIEELTLDQGSHSAGDILEHKGELEQGLPLTELTSAPTLGGDVRLESGDGPAPPISAEGLCGSESVVPPPPPSSSRHSGKRFQLSRRESLGLLKIAGHYHSKGLSRLNRSDSHSEESGGSTDALFPRHGSNTVTSAQRPGPPNPNLCKSNGARSKFPSPLSSFSKSEDSSLEEKPE